MAGMLALMLLAAGTRFRSFGLLATIHTAIIVAIRTAFFGMLLMLTLLMLTLLMLAVLLVTLLMLTVAAVLLVLVMTLMLDRRGLGRSGLGRDGGGDHERDYRGEILHRHSPEIHELKTRFSGQSRRRRIGCQIDAREPRQFARFRCGRLTFDNLSAPDAGSCQGRASDHAIDHGLVRRLIRRLLHIVAMPGHGALRMMGHRLRGRHPSEWRHDQGHEGDQ